MFLNQVIQNFNLIDLYKINHIKRRNNVHSQDAKETL